MAVRCGSARRIGSSWTGFARTSAGTSKTACGEVFGKCPAIEFHLDAGVDRKRRRFHASRLRATARRSTPQPGLRVASARACAADGSRRPSRPPRPPRRRFASLDTFVAGEANRLAITSAEMVVRQPGQHTPLMFYGPTSVGKTHLLEGIWTAARRSHQRLTAVYLSAEQFTSHFLEALRGSGLPSFRRKYRGVGLLMIDDLQFLVGKRATQVELLHTIDTFLREGRQLVFAADRSPAELAELGPELTTRLTGGLVCRIEPPDYATRLGIVGQMARRMKLHVPADVQQFVASRLTSHARELSGALCRLQATSQALGRPISLAMAEEALADLIRHSGRVVRLPDIEKAVCDVFGLEPASLQSDAKAKAGEPSADAGHVACPQAHPGRLERDRPLLRPSQPQHGHLGPEAGRRLDGLRPARWTWPSATGRSTTPSARSSSIWRRGKHLPSYSSRSA